VQFFCLRTNPICGQDRQWWVRWDDSKLTDIVGYEWLPGLLTERRFAEGLLLLSQWPEGEMLLQTAARAGVRVIGVAPTTVGASRIWEAYAAFATNGHEMLVLINDKYAATSTFEIADLLAHELTHVSDWVAGINTASGFSACISREQRARQAEWRFLTYLAQRFGGLPSPPLAASELSAEDQDLIALLLHIATVPNLDADTAANYQQQCTRNP